MRCGVPTPMSTQPPDFTSTVSPSTVQVAVPATTTQCSARCRWVW